MSAGQFQTEFYVDDFTLPYFVSIQPETLTLTIGTQANDAPTATATPSTYTLNLRESRKKNGVHAREVTVRLTAAGTGATAEYAAGTRHTLPWLDPTTFSAVVKNATGTYQGIPCVVVSRTAESRV